jgi:23S rRNA (uridine2552-2'-O)-methyltransferase
VSRLRDRRHRRDKYHKQAKQQGFAARSVFKLEELDRRFKLFRPGDRVLDLGCNPGSWMQYALQRVGQRGFIVGLDRQDPPGETKQRLESEPVAVVIGDVLSIDHARLLAALPDEDARAGFHVVLSDMAPDTTGIPFTDQARSAELYSRALDLVLAMGRPGANFVGKIFMGEGFEAALARTKAQFTRAKTVRPDATRKSSTEVYVVALGLAGGAPAGR